MKLDTNESVYIQATPNLAGEGLFTLDDDRVPQNGHYDATVTASNSVGNTTYNGTLSFSKLLGYSKVVHLITCSCKVSTPNHILLATTSFWLG